MAVSRHGEVVPWTPVVEAGPGGWELRERLVDVLEQVSELDELTVAVAAAQLLADFRSVWVRERRWRNNGPPPAPVIHVAGPVIACREYRRSCPGYIVDQRQACALCGSELIRGRWGVFFEQGDVVAKLGTIVYLPHGNDREIACSPTEEAPGWP